MYKTFIRRVRRRQLRVEVAGVERFTQSGLVLTNGAALRADVVVLGTGFHIDAHFFDAKLHAELAPESDGLWLYKFMLPPRAPGVAFVLHAMTFLSPLTAALQAAWIGDVLCGHVALPAKAGMLEATAEVQSAIRAFARDSPMRSTVVMGSFVAYHDSLMRDRGLRPGRFGGVCGPLANALVPMDPQQYKDCIVAAPEVPRRRRRAPRALRIAAATVAGVALSALACRRRRALQA